MDKQKRKKLIIGQFKSRLLAVLVCLGLCSGLCAQETLNEGASGQKTFGVKTGYVSRNQSALAGLYFQYQFSRHFRVQPSVQVDFRNNNRDAIVVDVDAQVPFRFADGSGRSALYPIAGLNYSSWNKHTSEPPLGHNAGADKVEDKDVSTRKSNFGLNLGAGFGLMCSSTLKLSLEAKYTFVKSNSGVAVSVGIGYVF